MLSRRARILFLCCLAVPTRTNAAETVQGPFVLDKAVVHPEQEGICLQYNSRSGMAPMPDEWIGSKESAEVGLVGYGVEAYRTLSGEVRVLDRTTTAVLWTQRVAPTLKKLSFIETKEAQTEKNLILLRVGSDRRDVRYFEIRTGHEKYLRRNAEGLSAVDEDKQELRGQPLDTIMSMSGLDSRITTSMCLCIRTLDEWRAVWRNHTGTTGEPPVVDLKKAIVIAVFLGQTWNCRGLALKHVIETEDSIEIFVRANSFQSAKGGGNNVYPFGFYVLPKLVKKVLVKKDIEDFISGAPRWILIEKFEP